MSRESVVFLIGFMVFLSPFLGLPKEWRYWLLTVLGVILMFIGYSLRRSAFLRSITEDGERRGDAFVEQHTTRANTEGKD